MVSKEQVHTSNFQSLTAGNDSDKYLRVFDGYCHSLIIPFFPCKDHKTIALPSHHP
jgi:hypothetical protein